METVELTVRTNCDSLIGKQPLKPIGRVIGEPVTLTHEGQTIGVYQKLSPSLVRKLKQVSVETKSVKGKRLLGLPTSASIFGSLPRNPVRADYCRLSKNSLVESKLLGLVQACSREVCAVYQDLLPVQYEAQIEASNKIKTDWKIEKTPFTTVNFNKNTAIKYHRDRANQSRVFSSVIILRSGITGGELVMPEFRVSLAQGDGFMLLFDGQSIIHGVCPINRVSSDGYRTSVVLYAMQQMENCYPFAEERERTKTQRTKKESYWRPTREQLGKDRGLQ